MVLLLLGAWLHSQLEGAVCRRHGGARIPQLRQGSQSQRRRQSRAQRGYPPRRVHQVADQGGDPGQPTQTNKVSYGIYMYRM